MLLCSTFARLLLAGTVESCCSRISQSFGVACFCGSGKASLWWRCSRDSSALYHIKIWNLAHFEVLTGRADRLSDYTFDFMNKHKSRSWNERLHTWVLWWDGGTQCDSSWFWVTEVHQKKASLLKLAERSETHYNIRYLSGKQENIQERI